MIRNSVFFVIKMFSTQGKQYIMLDISTVIAFSLFTIEWFHIWGHVLILFRVRLLPRKDLVRIRYYFLVDLLTVFSSSILFTGQLRWLAALQMIQHAYYFIYWDRTGPAKRIINWSSLDWFKSDLKNKWEIDLILGTAFDVVVHICMAYHLGQYLDVSLVMGSLFIVQWYVEEIGSYECILLIHTIHVDS
ncbi:hypothetical protein ACF0H5_007837 [Mactra antiquata]